ncbi:unnamed protein product [Calypogeia fissa]
MQTELPEGLKRSSIQNKEHETGDDRTGRTARRQADRKGADLSLMAVFCDLHCRNLAGSDIQGVGTRFDDERQDGMDGIME